MDPCFLRLVSRCFCWLPFSWLCLNAQTYDFEYSFQDVRDPVADLHTVTSRGLEKRADLTGPLQASYWQVQRGGSGELVMRFEFPKPVAGGSFECYFGTFKNEGAISSSGSLTVSKDGTNWLSVAHSGFGSSGVHVTGLPAGAFGGTILWFRAEISSRGTNNAAKLFFNRLNGGGPGPVTFSLKVNYAGLKLRPESYQPGPGFSFWIDGKTNTLHRIEHSTDLRTWLPLDVIKFDVSPFRMVDGEASNQATRFYRVVEVP